MTARPRRLAILQSNYIPWRGYFDIVASVDRFLIYDVVQFTKNDWRNRNRIKTANGVIWLTIPVTTSGRFGQTIEETRIADGRWASSHWRTIAQAYGKAPFFAEQAGRFAGLYERLGSIESLSAVNQLLIEAISEALGLSTQIARVRDLPEGTPSERLVRICQTEGAGVYLSGPSGRDYLELDLFAEADIAVEFIDYAGYEPYPQIHGPFEPRVSALDLLFNAGPGAAAYLAWSRRAASPPPRDREQ
jgi:hypothetical protein